MTERLEQQIHFLVEVDKMKMILRRTLLTDGSRRENDAEHSWHFALMAMVLYEYADQTKVNLNHVLQMALVHDLIEVYAGDTFAYDTEGYETKAAREREAADRLFSLLPEEQGKEIRSLWEEFERMETPDAQFAAAMDRFQPFINNLMTEGHTWQEGSISSRQVFERMRPVQIAAPELWGFVEKSVAESIQKGVLLP